MSPMTGLVDAVISRAQQTAVHVARQDFREALVIHPDESRI